MTVVGADPEQLRSTAIQFTQAADRLQGSLKGLSSFVGAASYWRGPDSERFRSEWNGQSVFSLNAAITTLRTAADTLRRNADEQAEASRSAGDGSAAGGSGVSECYQRSPDGLNGLWNEVNSIPKESSGYRVQKVVGEDGVERYIVYIVGNGGSVTQGLGLDTLWQDTRAISGELDDAQVQALRRLIPEGAEVMLVGYSQGGIDAQNIAASGHFNVQQIVTYGAPVRNDLNISATHLQYGQDIVTHSGGVNPGLYSSSAQDRNDNVEVFSAQPSLLTVFGLGEHMGGYGDLSQKWDGEAQSLEGGRAATSAAGLDKFQGDVHGQVDIDPKGNGDWK